MSNTTHTISFYQNAFGDASESALIQDGVTLREWLTDNVKCFDPDNVKLTYSQPLDMPVHSDVSIIYTPSDFIAAVTAIASKAFSTVVGALMPKQPKPPQSQGQGDNIDLAALQANTPKFGQPVREIFGKYKIYPDYLTPPHRYFENRLNHWTESLMCVGCGDYDIPLSEVRVGDTPIASYGSRASVTVFKPNDLIPSAMSAWWHTVPEVGGTRSGNSGLPIKPSFAVTRTAPSTNRVFSGTTIESLGGNFPPDWTSGLKLSIEYEQSYTVSGNKITGPMSGLTLSPGDQVALGGDLIGTYTVDTVQNKTTPLPGTASVLTGASAFSLNYAVQSIFSVTVGRLSGLFTLSDVFLNAADLVANLNAQADSTPIADMILFSSSGGKLVITEQPEYGGIRITVQDITNATAVFGDITTTNENATTGTAASFATPSSFTLIGFSVPSQSAILSINKVGSYFELIGNSGSVITVQRRKENGTIDWSGFQDTFTLSNSLIQLADSEASGGWQGWFDVQPSAESCTQIEYDVFFPQGLFKADKKGNIINTKCSLLAQWREVGGATIYNDDRTINIGTVNQIGFTFALNLPNAGKWQFRIKRTNPEYEGGSGANKCDLYGLRSKIVGSPARYPNFTVMHVKIKGSEAASAESENMISCVATRKLNGVATRSISDAVKYIARNQSIDNAKLSQLQTIWDSRNDNFDYSFETYSTVKQAVNIALGAGFAEMIIRDGVLTPVREAKRNPLERAHSFSAQNITNPITREIELLDDDETYGIDVEYLSDETWRVETVKCRKAGLTGSKVEKIKADGVTNRTKAWRYGMRALMRKRYQREVISASTELDGLNCHYNDLAAFIEDVPQYGQSALVVSSGSGVVRVTEPIQRIAGSQMVAVARDDKGRLGAMVDITRVDDYSFTPSASMGDLKSMQTIFIGNRDRIITSGIVVDVKPSNNGAKITAVNYTDRIYDFDDAQADN